MKKTIIFIIFLIIIPFLTSCNNKDDNRLIAAYVGEENSVMGGHNFILKIKDTLELFNIDNEYKQLIHFNRYDDYFFQDRKIYIINFVKNGSEDPKNIELKYKNETLEMKINFHGESLIENIMNGAVVIEMNKTLEIERMIVQPYSIDRKAYGSMYYRPEGHIIYIK